MYLEFHEREDVEFRSKKVNLITLVDYIKMRVYWL